MLNIDVETVILMVKKSQSMSCWKRLARATGHNEQILHNHFRSIKRDLEIESLFERNTRRRIARKRRRRRKQMLIHLVRLHRKYGFTPGRPEIDDAERFSSMMYIKLFGTLSNAHKLAKLIPNKQGEQGHLEVRPRYSLTVTE